MSRFSRVTIIELIEVFEDSLSVNKFNKMLLKYGLEEIAPTGTKPKRLNVLAKYLIDNPDEKGIFGSNLTQELIEEVIQRGQSSNYPNGETLPGLVNSLKRDGYIVVKGKLRTMLPEKLHLPEMEDELNSLLEKFDFGVPKGHLEQAINAHTRGDWASANSQLRTFVESLFDQIAYTLTPDGTDLSPRTSHERRQFLANELDPPFFLPDLNEWEAKGKGFIPGFWRRLHPEGSHPGLSDEEDSTFRLHLVIIVASYYLRRLDNRVFLGKEDILF
jgi:hypothetical protein